jgi:multimeric flavodoxin WrbA
MRILALLGSRNPRGQTARAAEAVAEGAGRAGADVETVLLPALAIERCRQCDERGWGLCRQEGRCIIEDDLAALIEKMRAADALLFATPVYFGDLSESLRAMLDRVRRTSMHEAGKRGLAGKAALGLAVAGGGGGGAPACCASLEKVLRTIAFDLVDLVPVRRQNLDFKCDVLRLTGEHLARGTLSAPGA